jgi:uncharacterized protein (DUF1697 family)
MKTYLILLRGVNVGGKNKMPMARLKKCLEGLGYSNVATFIASGNAILETKESAAKAQARIEAALVKDFKLDSDLVKVLALTPARLDAVIAARPKGFGGQPGKYHSDALFLMGLKAAKVMPAFTPREGVDKVWPGKGVIYSQRLSAERTKSRLGRIMQSPFYKSMTIRSWSTTLKLAELLKKRAAEAKAKGKAARKG